MSYQYNSALYRSLIFILVLLIFSTESQHSRADEPTVPVLNVYAIDVKVASYRDEKGEIVGVEIKQVQDFLEAKGVNYKIDLMPWPRILRIINSTTNSLVVSMVRTKERERKHIWLLELSTYDDHLITRNSPKLLNLTKQQIAEGKYTSICGRGSTQCKFLKDFGFPVNRILKVAGATAGGLAKMIIRSRADFMIDDMVDVEKEFNVDGIDVNQLTSMFKIHTMGTYLAGPKNLDPRLKKILMSN